jgi:zinc protease
MTIRTTPPPVAPAADWRFPAVRGSRLSNGVRVLTYSCPGQYVVSASLLFDVPLSVEPRDLEGVAGLTARTLTRGAAGRSAEAFADAVALCGADLEASAFTDGFAVRLSSPVSRLSSALSLMADAVRQPAFSTEEFAQEKRLRLQEIEQARAYPQHVAQEELNAALFGEARPARPAGGESAGVGRVERDDVVSYAATHLHPANATLIMAGDFGGLDPQALVDEAFGEWSSPASQAATPTSPPVVASTPRLLLVDWPDAPQSTLRLGGAGIDRGDPRWPAMFVANYAVGGNFSSRINTVLREDKGVTYGANSALDTSRGAGLVTVSTAVRSDATAQSVADVVTILAGAAGTLTDEEVENAVRAASESAALGFERADAVVNRVELLVSQRLPLDHVDTNLAGIRAVTTESANTAYVGVLDPSAMTVVVVGDAASVRAPLKDLGHGDLDEIAPSF